MNNIIVDSGYWYALFDSRDQYHHEANKLAKYINIGNVILPFPTLYESINTRFSKRNDWMNEFDRLLKLQNFKIIDDFQYKDSALTHSFQSSLQFKRPFSLVDSIIRIMLDDKSLNIQYLLSFNVKDFFDVCQRRNIEIIS